MTAHEERVGHRSRQQEHCRRVLLVFEKRSRKGDSPPGKPFDWREGGGMQMRPAKHAREEQTKRGASVVASSRGGVPLEPGIASAPGSGQCARRRRPQVHSGSVASSDRRPHWPRVASWSRRRAWGAPRLRARHARRPSSRCRSSSRSSRTTTRAGPRSGANSRPLHGRSSCMVRVEVAFGAGQG